MQAGRVIWVTSGVKAAQSHQVRSLGSPEGVRSRGAGGGVTSQGGEIGRVGGVEGGQGVGGQTRYRGGR